MNAQTKPQDGTGTVDLGREADFVLGVARVHPSTCEVEVGGRREIVQPRAMQVLVALARAEGAVVSRDQLIQSCWDGRVIGEDAINRAIAKVRAAAELSDPPAFEVETIPRVGFRLKVPAVLHSSGSPSSDGHGKSQAEVARAGPAQSRATVFAVGAAALLAALLLLFWWRNPMPGSHVPAARPVEASIAVLPFLNMSGDPAKEYFSDGFSEELLNDLANAPQLQVAARTSSFAFKGRRADVREIASKLHVRAVLEGSVRESGDRVRITAQLIDAGSGYHLWSQTYDRHLTDVLKVQDDIAHMIAAELTNRLLAARGTQARNGTIYPEAYRKYLLGKAYFERANLADNDQAIALFKEVTALQPDFPDGYAMLGYASLRKSGWSGPDEDGAKEIARAAAGRALALDPRNVTALIVAMNLALTEQDWNVAGGFVRRMQRINARNASVVRAAGFYYNMMGFPQRAAAQFRLATRLDPLSPLAWGSLAGAEGVIGQNSEAIAAGQTALALLPGTPGVLASLCIAHAGRGDIPEAQELAAKLETTPEGRQLKGCSMEIARATGDHAKARQIVDDRVRNNQGDPAYMGQNYLEIGEYAKAVPLLQRAYDAGDSVLYTLPFDPVTPRDFLKTAAWRELTRRPRFRAWQAAHDRLAAELKTQ